ncbi:unnamed protein product [Trifolium pratense]|uniref:Uncharacterized protein n=1 Tax=Trifolium pratense TaxID=57577 RepID=A0ACB0JJH2_TRIPR|nr:unnamed protein product [Trifolium pratense]
MYWEAFKAMQLAEEQLQPYSGTLVGFSGEQVDVMGYASLLTTFGEGSNAKTIKVRYLVVKTPFTSYNIIIGRPAFNALGAAMSTLYLAIKYPLENGGVGTVRGDQILAKKCYESSLKIRHRTSGASGKFERRQAAIPGGINMIESADMDPREEFQDRRVSPIEDLEQVQIGDYPHQTTSLGTALPSEERRRIIKILKDNADLFAWKPSDMPGIDEGVITHKLSISPSTKPVSQRKRKVGEERRVAIAEEVEKLKEAGFIEEIKYPSCTEEAKRIMNEVHEGSCGSHIGSRALAGKILRAGFYWPDIHDDTAMYVRNCDKCQRHANLHHVPGEPLKSVLSPWPFFMWGVDIVGPFPVGYKQARWIIVAVDYFTKWIEAEPVSSISAEQVKIFYWKKIICRFGLPKYIVSDNGTQFASEKVVEFCRSKGIKNTFISVEHPQANGQAESANKVILRALKRRLDSKGEAWVAHISPILWSYHTTPQSSTGEAPFTMVYGSDAMIPVEINPPSWRRETTTQEENDRALEENLDMIEERRERAHFREFAIKQRAARRYNTRVKQRSFQEGDLVLKRPMGKDKGGKFAANWEGPFRVQEAFEGGAYRLETMEGKILPRTWNVANLKFYYS